MTKSGTACGTCFFKKREKQKHKEHFLQSHSHEWFSQADDRQKRLNDGQSVICFTSPVFLPTDDMHKPAPIPVDGFAHSKPADDKN